MTDEEKLNRSLGQRARWAKKEIAEMAEGARRKIDEQLGYRKPNNPVTLVWNGVNLDSLPF
jgi:hypothetical protein